MVYAPPFTICLILAFAITFFYSYHYNVCTSSVNVKGNFIFINVNHTIILYLQLLIFAADTQVLSDMSYWNLKATVNTSNLWNIPRILFDKHITCSSQADMRLSPTKVFQKLKTSGSFVKRMNPVAVKAVKLVTNRVLQFS